MGMLFASTLARLLVTVVTMAAIYLLILKPILDTTTNSIDRAFEGGTGVVEQIEAQLDDAGVGGVDETIATPKQAKRILRCVKRAGNDPEKLKACVER